MKSRLEIKKEEKLKFIKKQELEIMKEKNLEIMKYEGKFEKYLDNHLYEERLLMISEFKYYLKCRDEILFSGEVWRDYKWEKENGWNYLNHKYGFLTLE